MADTEEEVLEQEETEEQETPDIEALAEIISDKDKKLTELETEVKQLKKSNAELLVKISAGSKPSIDLEQTIVDFCDTRKVSRERR